jgi:hypothetical protein
MVQHTQMKMSGKPFLMRLAGAQCSSEIEDMKLSFIWSQLHKAQKSFTQTQITRQDTKVWKMRKI